MAGVQGPNYNRHRYKWLSANGFVRVILILLQLRGQDGRKSKDWPKSSTQDQKLVRYVFADYHLAACPEVPTSLEPCSSIGLFRGIGPKVKSCSGGFPGLP